MRKFAALAFLLCASCAGGGLKRRAMEDSSMPPVGHLYHLRDFDIGIQTAAVAPAGQNVSIDLPRAEADRADRMVIYNAELRINVFSPAARIQETVAAAVEMGGYMKEREDYRVVVRVPAPRLDEFLARLRAFGTVVTQAIKGTDVTEEYVDLEIRLRNHEKTLERLRELLAKAKEVKEILEVEKELARVTIEIERIKGRMKYLSDQAALATVTVHFLSTRSAVQPARPVTHFPWVRRLGIEKVTQ